MSRGYDGLETGRRRLPPGFLLSAALALSGCSGSPGDPAKAPVAILDGRSVTRAELEAYFRESLPQQDLEEAPAAIELHIVKSRLFDNFLDEEILLAEARRRKVTVTDAEVDLYLGVSGDVGTEGRTPASRGGEERLRARRNLTIQRLRDASALRPSLLDAAEIEAYVAEHREELRAKPTFVFRAFPVAAGIDAAARAEEISRMRPRLARVARTGEDPGPEYGFLQEASTADLPEELRAAIEAMNPGDVSPPTVVDGEAWIFYLVAGPTPVVEGEDALRERGREALVRLRVEEAASRLLAELKNKTVVEIRSENLGFRYVAEPAS